jgi:hypothetical protein
MKNSLLREWNTRITELNIKRKMPEDMEEGLRQVSQTTITKSNFAS